MRENISFVRIFTNALFVTGMTIGVGILGLPVKTSAAGVIPSILTMIIIWLFMMCTAAVFIYKFTHPKTRSRAYPVLFQTELGLTGKWLGTFGYLVNYYGIMVAYLTGSAAILVNLVHWNIPLNVWMAAFFIVFTVLSLLGAERARKWNAVIMVILAGAFLVLLFKTAESIDISRLHRVDWAYTHSIFPIIMVAFAFHNVIPFVCRNLDGNARASFKAVMIGSLLALAMNILWMVAVIGALPLDGPGGHTLLGALQHNYPATVPLAAVLHSRVITVMGMLFGLAAIATSYVPTGLALTGFIRNSLSLYFKNVKNYAVILLSFGPPFIVAMLFPHVFLKAIDVAGGIGIMIIFGILPSLILFRMSQGKNRILTFFASIMLAVSSILLLCEIGQESGVLKIDPSVESWKVFFDK